MNIINIFFNPMDGDSLYRYFGLLFGFYEGYSFYRSNGFIIFNKGQILIRNLCLKYIRG